MKCLREISDRLALLQKLQPDQQHPSYWYLENAILSSLHCYEVEFDHETAANLLINSSPCNLGLDGQVFVKAEQAVQEILECPSFLETVHPSGGLNGTQVSNYIEQLTRNPARPQGIVVVKISQGLNVRDGMHRLIAYGVYHGGFHAEDFPLVGFYCGE